MSKRIEVEMVKSTRKAHLVKAADGREGWIQRRWLRDDSTVSQKTFDKAVEYIAEDRRMKDEAQAWREDYHPVTVERETTKAVAAKIHCDNHIERAFTRLVWFPKSMMRDGKAPGWMILSKLNDLSDEIRSPRFGGGWIDDASAVSVDW